MATINFRLRSPKAKTPQPVTLVFFHNGQKIKYPTGLKVTPDHWNSKAQRVRNTTDEPERDKINAFLSELTSQTEKAMTAYTTKGEPFTLETIKNALDVHLGKIKPKEKPEFLDFVKRFIAQSENRLNPANGKKISYGTIQKYRTTYRVLVEFSEEYHRPMSFENIDLDFYHDFTEHLSGKLNLATNTIGKYIQTLKTFLNAATESGINQKIDFKSRRFKTITEESEHIYLTDEELTTLYELDLSQNQRLERVRDLFLIGAYTGLRFSDFIRVRIENVKNGNLTIEQKKTGSKVVIPINPIVLNILKRYEGKTPKVISNQKMNDYLKDLGKASGFTEHISKAITKGGKRITQKLQKWELLTTHTARRSFATNLFKGGVPAQSIMKVTGHSTENSFMKYLKLTPDENANIIAEHWKKTGQYLKVV